MRKSRLSHQKRAKLLENFVAGTTARCTAKLVEVNRKTASYYFGADLDNKKSYLCHMVRVRRRIRLSRSIQIELIKYFCVGSTARSAAELTGVNRNTAILFFHKFRETIHKEIVSDESPMMSDEIQVDESYFGGRRKGKRGRGAPGKVPVFGLLKRDGKVYAVMIARCKDKNINASDS